MSGDGTALTFSLCSSSGECRAFHWSAETGRRQVPAIAERVRATRLSADGQVMLLDAQPNDDTTPRTIGAVVYRLGGTPTPTGLRSDPALLLSEDGSVVVGLTQTSAGGFHLARWSEAGGLETLAVLSEDRPDFYPILSAMTPDATVIVGAIHADVWQPFRWSEAEGLVLGLEGLAAPADGAAFLAVSRDGERLAGVTLAGSIRGVEAFHWTRERGLINLGDVRLLELPWPGMLSLSDDGSVVAGTLADNNGGPDDTYPFRWTEESGVVPLVDDGASGSEARLMSGDGSVIVGVVGQSIPIYWSRPQDYGRTPRYRDVGRPEVENRRWRLSAVGALSRDGTVVAGSGECAGVPAVYRAVLDLTY